MKNNNWSYLLNSIKSRYFVFSCETCMYKNKDVLMMIMNLIFALVCGSNVVFEDALADGNADVRAYNGTRVCQNTNGKDRIVCIIWSRAKC